VVPIHGFPKLQIFLGKAGLSAGNAGYRVITYDRRDLATPVNPHLAMTMIIAANTLMTKLTLAKCWSVFQWGTGEVTRYLGKYGGSERCKSGANGSCPPFC